MANTPRKYELAERKHASRSDFHPYFVRALLGLALIFILGAWSFLAGTGYIGLVAGIVTFFTLVVLAIPLDLWHVKSQHEKSDGNISSGTFREWLSDDVEIWDDRMSGREAMITALLPIAAVAMSAVLFAIAFQLGTSG